MLADQGVPIAMAMEILGHATITVRDLGEPMKTYGSEKGKRTSTQRKARRGEAKKDQISSSPSKPKCFTGMSHPPVKLTK